MDEEPDRTLRMIKRLEDRAEAAAARIAELEAENARLREEVEAWRERFPGAGFNGNMIVLSG